MGSTQVYRDDTYLKEVWALFGVGAAVIVVRFMVRLRTNGWRRFQGDDYMAIVVFACYAADAITVTIIYQTGANVDYRGSDLLRLTREQVNSIEYGSKMQLFAWYTYTALIWGLKACMLFFFHRLTFGLTQQIFVKALGVACFVTYIAMFLTITLSCLPYHLNWQVRPMPPDKCTFRRQNFYTCTILNVVTDAAILCIPIPLLWKLRISIPKKVCLSVLLSSGMFVITAAIVRNIKTLDAHPSALTVNRWGVRETIAGIIAVNAPILKPIFRKAFWSRNFRLPSTTTAAERGISRGSSGSKTNGFSRFLRRNDIVELAEISDKTNTTGTATKQSTDGGTVRLQSEPSGSIHPNTSQECFVQKPQRAARPRALDQIDLENGLPHPGVRVDTAPTPPPPPGDDDEGEARPAVLREPVVPRPQRVFKTPIGQELDSIKGLPHPGIRIPTPGIREEKPEQQRQYIPDLPSPRIERLESVLTPWPEEQQFSPWGYDTETTNMDSIQRGGGGGGGGQSRSP